MPTKCSIHNCTKPSVSKGLCDTHRKRLSRHGSVENTRPADWGSREKHPAYNAWCNLRRFHAKTIPDLWRTDFWAFANDVPPKPAGRVSIQRADPTQPWSRENFYWREPQVTSEQRADRAAYMREHSRKARRTNPGYHKNMQLRRLYGIDLAEYNRMLDAQNGCCDVCGNAEKNEIAGKTLSLAVDHDHDTGAVRALLCSACNTAIGLLGDNPGLIDAAKAYLAKHGKV
jgi:hypothetical protein